MKLPVNKHLTPLGALYAAFIAVEIIIYAVFNVLVAVMPDDPIYLKYSGVLICFAVACAMVFFYKKDGAVLAAALLFTAISDLFILVLDDYYEVGVTTFLVVQSIYLFRLYEYRLNKIFITLIVRAALAALTITLLAVFATMNYLLAVVSLYFVMLCANCADAFVISKNGIKNIMFAIGLLLFIGCDVCVGIYNFGSALGIALPHALTEFALYAIWAFYLPSQVLIVCSVSKVGLRPVKGDKIETVQAA